MAEIKQWDELTSDGKLDRVLDFMYEHRSEFINSESVPNKIGLTEKNDITEIQLIIHQLEVDGNIYHFPNSMTYRILFSGKRLKESGGYTEQQRKAQQRQTWLDGIATSGVKNAERLILAGWAAAIGTAFLGLMELIKLIPFHHHHHFYK